MEAATEPRHPAVLAATDPDRPAIVMEPSGEVVTYGQFAERARRVAALFRERGLKPGDHIAFCLPNSPLFLEIVWGAHYAGLFYTACSTRLKGAELAYIVDNCAARAFICSARFSESAAAIEVEAAFCAGGEIDGYEAIEPVLDEIEPAQLDESWPAGADMLYSSGTTGSPKGIKPRASGNRIGDPMMIGAVLENFLDFHSGDVYLSPAPLYHAAPLRFCATVLQLGGTVVVMERFDPAGFLRLVERHSVTHSQLVPTMFVRFLRLDAQERSRHDISTLRGVVHAAAPCPVEVKQQMLDWWGPIIHEYYSATEGAGLTWCDAEQWLQHPGTVGTTIIGVAHIVGEDGSELGPGETGAVYFSDGPEFEYHNDPEKTRATIDDRGWATFGDIGHLDSDGYLYLTDRASYTIITGGVNVYPQEAEDALLAHPAVLDAAVFGVADADFGERVHAVVQPAGDVDDRDELERELIEHCRSRLADVKCPRGVDFRAELPRHETGKLYKRLLQDEYARSP